MSGFEFFNPSEGGESYDPAAFERFKEQVKKNGQFVAALRKSEQKQKKKDDKLAQILLAFIQNNQNSELVTLVSALLKENIPAGFILSLISLGNVELKKNIELAGQVSEVPTPGERVVEVLPEPKIQTSEFSLMAQFDDPTIPLMLKMALNEWGVTLYEAGSSHPFRMLETALTHEGNVKKQLTVCASFVLSHYLGKYHQTNLPAENLDSFSEFILKGIMKKLKEQVENQKLLG